MKLIDGYDSFIIESKDDIVTLDSCICVTPYNSTTKKWLSGLMEITTMKEFLSRKDIPYYYCKEGNVSTFFDEYFKGKKDISRE